MPIHSSQPLVLTLWQDGVIDVELAGILSQGSGSLHGVDSSPKMIEAARAAVGNAENCTFEGKRNRPPLPEGGINLWSSD